jgi:hypothetical protein
LQKSLNIINDAAALNTASSSSSSTIGVADDKGKENYRTCTLVDFEAFQKMPLNNLSNRSAHWDPKVFRKIAQLIDPPKSTSSQNSALNSRSNSPIEKKFQSNCLFSLKLFNSLTNFASSFSCRRVQVTLGGGNAQWRSRQECK